MPYRCPPAPFELALMLRYLSEEIKAPKKKARIMELLALMRSPEIFALMSAMRSMLKSISSKG